LAKQERFIYVMTRNPTNVQ